MNTGGALGNAVQRLRFNEVVKRGEKMAVDNVVVRPSRLHIVSGDAGGKTVRDWLASEKMRQSLGDSAFPGGSLGTREECGGEAGKVSWVRFAALLHSLRKRQALHVDEQLACESLPW